MSTRSDCPACQGVASEHICVRSDAIDLPPLIRSELSADEKRRLFTESQIKNFWSNYQDLCQHAIYYDDETECGHPDNLGFCELCTLHKCPIFEDI